jgi:hypothetical protein
MSSIFLGFGKSRKVKKIVLEVDNYYDVLRLEEHNKVSKGVIIFKDRAIKWWTSKKRDSPRWWQT